MQRLLLLLVLFASAAAAQPSIGGLQNNYSFLLPGSPNYAFAQGGIFVIYGTNMAPDGLLTGDFPLNRNLGGVSIKIMVNGVTTEAVPYYVSPGQISAILPSSTPAGSGTITVAYNGQTSAPYPIEVVAGAFGLLTMSGNGLGQAVVQDADYTLLTPANAAQEGQTVIFWGTGLGADPNDETELNGAPQPVNGPFELYIGNKPADVLYHGRSQFPGLDQIVARIPSGLSGCFVSTYAKTGAYISNFTTIPVSTGGGCSDNFATSEEIERFSSQQSVASGWLYLAKFDNYNPGGSIAGIPVPSATTVTNSATGQFLRYRPFDYTNYGSIGQPSIGNCVMNTFRINTPFVPPILENLDAGELKLTLPDGTVRDMPKVDRTYFLGGGSGVGPLFIPDEGGSFTFSGSGGAQVGPFSATLTLPQPFHWNEQTSVHDIDRTQPLTLTWTGGDPSTYVVVTGLAMDPSTVYTQFACTAATSAGAITIPRDILASMIPSFVNPGSTVPTGQLFMYNYLLPQKLSASGVDSGNISYFVGYTTLVDYK